ncbi:hypothetical protein SDRG_12193 [Saprolegnia diclina VS20]|uniref:Uncharacterized protein n=1 Tax=Saprolegnia diclina (strain VS20) TaxID=1156394 RepID=T0Q9H9_SAPDV|nr:hypothetical protein SDRG_12193 [Saprolegnia diclina VS20]EQC30135.1 hypothetical protein SDRG_12193 [Saprolegnia diclina VS20]|eukprot:XP_008616478.1 hypothetical protein SDRG_12193 [Saprolegnia diclina VS20]
MVAKRRSIYSTMTKGPIHTGATLRFTHGPYYAPSPDVVADEGMTREDIAARIHRIECAKRVVCYCRPVLRAVTGPRIHRIECAKRVVWYYGAETYAFVSQDVDDLALVFGICDATTLEELSAADTTLQAAGHLARAPTPRHAGA